MLEQPIPGTPVYRVRPVTGTKVRTLHRNLLLPLGVKYQPDIDSDESDSDPWGKYKLNARLTV